MIKKRNSCLLILMLMLWSSVQTVWSGTTGKIEGAVTDRETGEALPGANIIIDGTSLGAASDLDGRYTIINVPPGVFTVTASFVGYGTIHTSQVQVWMNQTTAIDFKMSTETIKGQVVTVVAERKVVRPDVSTSVAAVSSSEIVALPVSNVSGIMSTQAGVRGMDIRGSTQGAALFMVDGVTMRDPRNNEPISTVPLNAVEAISIERGGFNAEYGQVQSGIVNVVTREGSKDKYQFSAEFKYSPPHAKYFGISPFDANSYWLRPYLDDQVAWNGTVAGWDKYTAKQYPEFAGWNKISQILLTNNDPSDDLSPAGAQQVFLWQHRKKDVTDQPDYDIDLGFGGPVPIIGDRLGNLRFYSSYRRHREMLLIPLTRSDYVDDDLMVRAISDVKPSMKLRMSFMLGNRYTMMDNWVYGWDVRYPDRIVDRTRGASGDGIFGTGWFSLADIKYRSYSAKFTHMISPVTMYDVSLEHFTRSYLTRPPAAYDTTPDNEIVPGYFVDDAPFGFYPEFKAGFGQLYFGGHSCRYRDNSEVSATTLKADFTSQITSQHLVKTGVEFVYNDIDLNYVVIGVGTGDTTRRADYPVRAAWYVQDKMEAKGFILNAGLRLDYSNSNSSWYDFDPFYGPFFSTKYDASANYVSKKTEGQWQLSPRVGISHPVTENSKLFFNYGHFKQMPSYETLFLVTRTATKQLSQIGDPNITLAKTISYELGYDHSLFDNRILIQAAAFYKDISDQQRTVNYYGIADVTYSKTTSNGYSDIRGVELTLKKPMGTWWNGFANYTYQSTKNGRFASDRVYEDPSQQIKYDNSTQNVRQERYTPQPYARVNLAFFTPPDYGPRFGKIKPLNDWLLNVLFDWQKGASITWNPLNAEEIRNNVVSTDMHNLTLRLSKKFVWRPMDIYVFVDVGNTLNSKFLSYYGNINSFSDSQDEIDYMNSLHLPKNPGYNNIVGDDKYGDYRKDGVDYQPIEKQAIIANLIKGQIDPSAIYYGRYDAGSTKQTYWQNLSGNPGDWQEVSSSRMDKIKKDKAYIDMPNETSFWFLNPRQIFFGFRVTFNI
jgi:outer membrane receptor protein involved in Fe transport